MAFQPLRWMKIGEARLGLSYHLNLKKEYGKYILLICAADIQLQPILGFSSGSLS